MNLKGDTSEDSELEEDSEEEAEESIEPACEESSEEDTKVVSAPEGINSNKPAEEVKEECHSEN